MMFTSVIFVLFSVIIPWAKATTCPILSTPTYGIEDAVFTACANTTIQAPASLVYEILTNFDAYKEWNTFVVNVELLTPPPYQVGSVMLFTDALLLPPTNANTTSQEIITMLSPANTTAVWRYDSSIPALIVAEHVSQIVSLGENTSWYNSWETYYRPASEVVQVTLGEQLVAAFEVQGEDLKRRAEGLAQA